MGVRCEGFLFRFAEMEILEDTPHRLVISSSKSLFSSLAVLANIGILLITSFLLLTNSLVLLVCIVLVVLFPNYTLLLGVAVVFLCTAQSESVQRD